MGTGGAASGGTGGTPLPGCDPYDPAACEGGDVCAVVDDQLGTQGGTECITPGDHVPFAACRDVADCQAGSFCDRVTATCKPLCQNSSDCPREGDCTPAQTVAGTEIPGLKLCIAACEPIATTGCDDSSGPVNCTFREDLGTFDCFSAGNKAENFACVEHAECDVGLGCLEVNGVFGCLNWCVYDGGSDICSAAEHPTATFALCVPQAPSITSNGVTYGGCLKQL